VDITKKKKGVTTRLFCIAEASRQSVCCMVEVSNNSKLSIHVAEAILEATHQSIRVAEASRHYNIEGATDNDNELKRSAVALHLQ
jgi:hypothetical protein